MRTFLNKVLNFRSTDVTPMFDARRTGWLFASLLISLACSFVIGYFVGKHDSAQELTATMSRDAFADQIYNSLCVVSKEADNPMENIDAQVDEAADSDKDAEAIDGNGQDANKSENARTASAQAVEVRTQYYALLAGFNSLKRAELFAARATSKRVPVLIKERVGHTAKGKKAVWYQVVTEPYEDRSALNSIVAILKKEEKLHDVKIVQG